MSKVDWHAIKLQVCVYFLAAIALCARFQEAYVFMSADWVHVVYHKGWNTRSVNARDFLYLSIIYSIVRYIPVLPLASDGADNRKIQKVARFGNTSGTKIALDQRVFVILILEKKGLWQIHNSVSVHSSLDRRGVRKVGGDVIAWGCGAFCLFDYRNIFNWAFS